ncbi:MAG: glycosyltransferase family 39 protein [Candidatus Eremiobacteraeota bacterium]|nr:glycosyltransferase family 39 protein [Candidatus Eremiobacteraeota bacterium]
MRYQLVQPGSSYATTLESLERDDPQHPPLYFVLERLWQSVGTSVVAWRSLSVIFGLALLLAVFRLASELFDRDVGLVATALVAVSPFHVAYAQYNREYALWALLTALSSVLVLVSLRRGTAIAWVAYAASVILGLYTDPLFLTVAAAHVAYVGMLLLKRNVDVRRAGGFAVALLSAGIAYVPWLLVMWNYRHVIETTTEWYAKPLPAHLLAGKWFFEIASVFFDVEYGDLRLSALAVLVVVTALTLAFVGIRSSSRRGAFVVSLVVTSAAPLVVADLVLHQSRSTAGRYFSPAWLGVEVAVAAGLTAFVRGERPVARLAAVASVALLVSAGVASLAVSGPRSSWWVDSQDGSLVAIARALSAERDKNVCYVDNYGTALVLGDAVTAGVGLSPHYTSGCLGVGTASEVAKIAPASGRFVKGPAVPPGAASAIDEFHEQMGRARHFRFEEIELWEFRRSR